MFRKPGNRYQECRNHDDVCSAATEDAITEGDASEVGIKGKVREERGEGEESRTKHQAATFAKKRNKYQPS